MAVNPDPKPGRWILPLVILGMMAFTYFFVRSLPEASPDTTLVAGPSTTAGVGGDGSTTTVPGEPGVTVDDAAATYLAELDRINGELAALDAELTAVNTGFDADPREIEYGDAEPRFEAVVTRSTTCQPPSGAWMPPITSVPPVSSRAAAPTSSGTAPRAT